MDRFNNVLVTQTLSVGMEKLKPVLFPLLAEVLRADGQTIDGIYERNDEALRAKEGLEQNKGWFALPGESHPKEGAGSPCRVKRRRRKRSPRLWKTACATEWILKTARKPAFSLTRNTTAGLWHALPPGTPCWTALPTPAALP